MRVAGAILIAVSYLLAFMVGRLPDEQLRKLNPGAAFFCITLIFAGLGYWFTLNN
jgi:hypothetical protein